MNLFRSRIAAACMAVIAVAPALWITGCEDGHSSSQPSTVPQRVVLESGKTLLFGGWVNDWCWVPSSLLREQIDAMADAGWDGYLIEMGGSAKWGDFTEEENRSVISIRYAELVDMLAARGMLLLNSVQNDNAGKGKYGDQSPPLDEQQEFSAFLVNTIDAVGRPDVVMVQPVAETESNGGYALERLCAAVLTDFTLVNNGNGGRPNEKPAWATYNAAHPWGVDSIKAEDIVVGDTRQFIEEMDATGNMTGDTNPAKVQEAYDRCGEEGVGLFGLYLFDAGDNPKVDYATIQGVVK